MQVSFCSPLNFSHRKILSSNFSSGVILHEESNFVVIDNGIVQVTLSKPGGFVTGIKYNGVENILETKRKENDRGYWDIVWYKPGAEDIFDQLQGENFSVITQNEDQVEVSFNRKWDISIKNSIVPLNIDKRYILRRGSSGFYTYTIMERLEGWPTVSMDQIRIVFKLQNEMFNYMVVSDNIQKIMPTYQDRENGQALAYPEAVLLTKTSNPELRGEVDDKYEYSMDRKDSKVYGWISKDPAMGFWVIRPSDEFCTGGPFRQELTAHTGPFLLSVSLLP
ncbi:hypothetical protein JCGZ_05359 [Jatropha curcas]|uniref:Rhamnogalacturonan lyase domain-containing protein n=1 Tax=Jatropha curcas TaxID=180498 RepID=A0A067L0A0_JATCU|nr:hypothetical protein JCGZ_05359 [Jatropha curcas]